MEPGSVLPGSGDPGSGVPGSGVPGSGDPAAAEKEALDALVGQWLTVPDVAELMGVEVTVVRQAIRESQLVAMRVREGAPLRIPAGFVHDGKVTKHLAATINLLRDRRYTDLEILRWLHTEDDSLPGTPIQALVENRGTEVKRRAQALGF